jgi:hypothetical protein
MATLTALSPAMGNTVLTFTGQDVNGRSASAVFDFDGSGSLKVTLANEAAAAAQNPTYVLTALFFDLSGDPTLTPLNALLAGASQTIVDNVAGAQPAGGVVGGEWAYGMGFVQYDANQGISSSGFGLFGSANFPGPILPGGHTANAAVNGLDYGIVGSGGTANQGGLNGNPFIQDTVDFYLSGVPIGPEPSVSNVVFQYGTGLDEPSVPGDEDDFGDPPNGAVPEPLTLLAVGTAVAGVARYLRRRRIR